MVRNCGALPDICPCQEATAAVLQVASCASQGLPALQLPEGIVRQRRAARMALNLNYPDGIQDGMQTELLELMD